MGILLAIHVIVTILLILVVLIQKNEGGSSLFANSGGNSMFNARGTSNILTKTTWVLASIFLVNCVVMATIESSHMRSSETITDAENNPGPSQKNEQSPTKQPNPSEQSQAEQPKSGEAPQPKEQAVNDKAQEKQVAPNKTVQTDQQKSAETIQDQQSNTTNRADQVKQSIPAKTGQGDKK